MKRYETYKHDAGVYESSEGAYVLFSDLTELRVQIRRETLEEAAERFSDVGIGKQVADEIRKMAGEQHE